MIENNFDVVIVGAGASGIGLGCMFKELGFSDFVIVERHSIGESFRRWPESMQFITPSFTSNFYGHLDLNAVASSTSPAFSLRKEHPTGKEYARYLEMCADIFELPVVTQTDVRKISKQGSRFTVKTSRNDYNPKFVVWAAGEYQYPQLNPFKGAENCIHNSQIRSWKELKGDEHIVIGGYESGIDAAVNLAALGRKVTVLDRATPWEISSSDPSRIITPFTYQRLNEAYRSGKIALEGNTNVKSVMAEKKRYLIETDRKRYVTASKPILASGFRGSLKTVEHLFERENGHVKLSDSDESTKTPGLFLAGPEVRHDDLVFCFIYKFRLRFGVIVKAIFNELGLDTDALDNYRHEGLFLDDLSCCGNECTC